MLTHILLQLGKNANLKLLIFHFLLVALLRHGYTHNCECYRLVAMMSPQFQYHVLAFNCKVKFNEHVPYYCNSTIQDKYKGNPQKNSANHYNKEVTNYQNLQL
jgi:hypothetical protein